MQYLTVWDLVLTPIYLLVLTFIAKRMRDKRYPPGHPLRKYYLPGLWVKFGGAIFIALIYQFYYEGGDTFNFFTQSKVINSSLNDSFSVWFELLQRKPQDSNPHLYKYISQLFWYRDPPSYRVVVIGAIIGLLNGTTYLPIALVFAFVSFTGIWAMYRTFANLYPKLHKELAIAFLFIPSTFVWGSALFKDTVCMFGLGWMTYTTFRIFINRDFSFKNLFLLALSFYLVATIKIYILLAFVPALFIWLLTTYASRIPAASVRFLAKTFFIAVTVGAFFLISQVFANELQKYSLERIANTANTTAGWINYASGDEGSAYDLGGFSTDIGSMLLKLPQAVVVTLYRPFPWEARKLIVMLSALEAIFFIYFTVQAFRKRGIGKAFNMIFKDPNLFFFATFSVIFAFAVGISSYNFGALSRYKIPCLPFYAALLAVLLFKDKKPAASKTQMVRQSSYAPT